MDSGRDRDPEFHLVHGQDVEETVAGIREGISAYSNEGEIDGTQL